ncbi:MAG: hypothetical protein JXM68_09775 [Sedimentisphaerales bacterium]|nr:hypothetical protein [Sedimentisphaerales bacterium]
MSRINTNVTAMTSTRILNQNNDSLNVSLERLSTGLKINRGADDPAGLIASENLSKQIKGTETGIKNAERANTIIATADGALGEISEMLTELQGLLGEVANKGGMSQEEIEANQLQADSILNTIDRIANSTEFQGIKLLNGNFDYTVSGGTATTFTSAINDLKVNGAKLIDGAAMTVTVAVTTSAQTGKAYLSGAVSGAMTIKVGTNRGNTELTFASGTSVANVATSINAVKEVTGVSATVSTNSVTIKLNSVDYGTDAYISVEKLTTGNNRMRVLSSDATTGAKSTETTNMKDFGVNAIATINGSQAVANGKKLSIKTAMLDAEMNLANGRATTLGTSAFTITGGGADFAIGAVVDAIGLEAVGIKDVSSTSLGTADDGRLSTLKSGGANSLSSDNLYTAQRILNTSIKDVSKMRGRLGSFQKNTLEKTINTLTVANENLASAQSAIRDTNFASETSAMTRSQILVQSATSVLAQANSAPQSILQLL